MIYLVLAIIASSCVSIFMRLGEGKCKNNISMLAMNYVMCTGLSAVFAVMNGNPLVPGTALSAGMGIVNGVVYLAAFVLLNKSVSVNGVGKSATFMKLGVLVPTIGSMILFGEKLTAAQTAGFLIACAAIVMMKQGDAAGAKTQLGLLIILLVCGGMADIMSKFYEELGDPAWSQGFLAATFGVALVLCVIYAKAKGQGITKYEVIYGLLIGIPNFFSTKFLLAALGSVPAAAAYPLYSAASILIVTVTGMAAFGEKLTGKQKAAMGAIIAAIVLLNM